MSEVGYRYCTVGKPLRDQESRYREKMYIPIVHFKGFNYLLKTHKKRASDAVAYATLFAKRWNSAEDFRLSHIIQKVSDG